MQAGFCAVFPSSSSSSCSPFFFFSFFNAGWCFNVFLPVTASSSSSCSLFFFFSLLFFFLFFFFFNTFTKVSCLVWVFILVECCVTSTETICLLVTGSPGRPPWPSHSSWALSVFIGLSGLFLRQANVLYTKTSSSMLDLLSGRNCLKYSYVLKLTGPRLEYSDLTDCSLWPGTWFYPSAP